MSFQFNMNATSFVPSFMKNATPPPAAAPASTTPAAPAASTPAAPAPKKTTTPPPKTTSPTPAKTSSPQPKNEGPKKKASSPAPKAEAPKKASSPAPKAEAPKKTASPAPKAEPVVPKKTKEDDDDLGDEEEGGMEFTDEQIQAELKRMALEEAGLSGTDAASVVNGDDAVDLNAALQDADTRENVNVVFIGHVDAGKSTISGQLLLQMHAIDQRIVEKYEREAKDNQRESWYLAYVMDNIAEEKSKGKTIEVGRALFATDKRKYTILDAPGHKSYVPNMIAGAAQADVGILVISARKGEFEAGFERGGQTREHAQLAKTVGIRQLVVVINKMDDIGWDKARYDDIEAKLITFLKQCGFARKDFSFLPISGLTGRNIVKRMEAGICSWYDGPCLIEALDALEMQHGREKLAFRLPIIDKFKDSRGNNIVMGKVETGTLNVHDTVVIMPTHVPVEILAITVDDNVVPLRSAKPGDNIRLCIKGESTDNIQAGYVMCKDPNPAVVSFDAQVVVMELVPPKLLFSAGFESMMHIHTAVEECTVTELTAQLNRSTGKVEKRRPAFVRNHSVVMCRITMSRPVAVECFSDFQQLGRFTLRDGGQSVAFGKILKFVETVDKLEVAK